MGSWPRADQRFSWLLGGMLHPDMAKAKESAQQARRFLLTSASRPMLVQFLEGPSGLAAQLGIFCDAVDAQPLWRTPGCEDTGEHQNPR